MSKIISTTKINACFLAIVFLAGTFAAISPSFMIGAHAQQYGMGQKYNTYEPDYGMDNSYDNKQSYGKDSNSYDKSKDSSTIVKKVKCNNINVNVNGFNGVEVGTLPTALSDLATNEAQAADEGEIGASSSGSDGGRPSGSDSDSRFDCIDNNDFAVVEEEEEEPISDLCEECFAANSALQTEIVDALVEFDGGSLNVDGVTALAIGPGTDTIEQLCAILESSTELFGGPISTDMLDDLLSFLLEVDPNAPNPEIDALIECLLRAGIIVERESLSDSISDNGIASANVQCTGDAICARITE